MIEYLTDTSLTLSLIAPLKHTVHVVGEFNAWQVIDEYEMQKQPDGETFVITINNLKPDREYAYQFLIDRKIAIADPYSEKILDPQFDKQISANTYPNLRSYPFDNPFRGTVSVLQTNPEKYNWQVESFLPPAKEELVIYELLIRDFVESRKYRDVANYIPYFKQLGINAIELLPVQEFTGNDSWGYNPTFYFASDKAYGTKNDLKYLIDKCHENGIAVILDVVFNHADKHFSYYKAYEKPGKADEENPFFNEQATHPFSVFFDFNHESRYTQAFFDDVCHFWLTEYKVDGLRFDLTKGFTQVLSYPDVQRWSSYDASRIKLLKRFYDKIRTYHKKCYLILEHLAANDEETELADYGFLLWGHLNHQFRNLVRGKKDSVSWLSHQNRGWKYPHLVGYIESHDEERLLFDALRKLKDLPTALVRAKAAAVLFFIYPGPKLFWQFGEFGYDIPIDFNGRTGVKPISWEYLKNPGRQALMEVYSQMIHFRKNIVAWKDGEFIEDSDSLVKQISINHPEMKIRLLVNFGLKDASVRSNLEAGIWYDFFGETTREIAEGKQKILLKAGEYYLFTTKKINKF
ncbi:alpha-amylase family glycosyl hydrolase [Emticicia sp. 21SJ11W-3]|uniref:alpha-amylase family glycosyl hydrolase n=1 Tax=Emticicia sp. 21SJ11W-3 TaxID=2916755 RepID=UPI0020A1475F|nr:alpha-amylase family glycosyl hydrolase [Emticicia sp. 21SJ11W-3]UTA69942.1 alpha-amylase family glycosyl hydrolase [Emticicia sp. 21SJ11W-3]